jgi:glutathione synthase/RimK-type ligase-like ATP-grasp enzyme
MGSSATVLIVGSPSDEHASAVLKEVGERATTVFVDASVLASGDWLWADGFQVGTEFEGRRTPRKGWLRRLAPPDWHHGVEIGTLRGVETQAGLQLLAAIADAESGIEWLTGYWATMRAENKLIQYGVASRLGVRVPATRVTADPADLRVLGDRVVMKPLGIGAYTKDGVPHAVHARLVEQGDASLRGLSAAPYIAQQHIDAVRHLRVPTVLHRSWPCELGATGLPLDWRADHDAHSAWRTCPDGETVGALAVQVAAGLELGYSCQDWIEDADGEVWLVDVNPGGQWLFLPDDTAVAVTRALADWLVG